MATASYFFVAASADRRLFSDVAKDLEVSIFVLKERPVNTPDGLVLFDRLVLVEEHATVKKAQARLRRFERMSPRRRAQVVESVNPEWLDLSAKWFPIAAMSSIFQPIADEPGDAPGGIAAKLDPRIPPRTASEEVDPISIMSIEEMIEAGAYKRTAIGPR